MNTALRSVTLLQAVMLVIAAGLPGCGGPARHPTPRIEATGASRTGAPSLTPEGAAATTSAGASSSVVGGGTTSPLAVAVSVYGFLDDFVARLAAAPLQEPRVMAVLPPFNVNPLFGRHEVSRLGEEIAGELLRRLGASSLGPRVKLVSPARFVSQLGQINRSLADLDSPAAAVGLAMRTGARYLVRGVIEGSGDSLTIRLECVDLVELLPVEDAGARFVTTDAVGQQVHGRYRNGMGHVVLGSWRIGALAPPARPALRDELRLIIGDALRQLLREARGALGDRPIAVLSTQLPREIALEKYQRALERRIQTERRRFVSTGLDESSAMYRGPVRIMGTNYKNLAAAEDFARQRQLGNAISDTGLLRDTLSRLIFDILEDLAGGSELRVIPHDQLTDQTVLYSAEEAEKMREGILSEKTREYFKTRGAGALLFNELIEAGDSYELVFQLRRLDNLERLTARVPKYLEPRFAVELRDLLKE